MVSSTLHQRSLVVVDQQPDHYLHLVPVVEEHGATVRTFGSGEELLRNGIPADPFCWLINYHLPDMMGLELCELLHGRLDGENVFIVMNDYDEAAELAVLCKGIAQLACKPLHPVWLQDSIRLLRVQQVAKARMRRTRASYPIVSTMRN